MVAVKIQNFGGMVPAVDPRLLPRDSAEYAENASLSSGALEGFHDFKAIFTPLDSSTQRVFRIPINLSDALRIPNSYWLEFDTPNVDVIQAPTDSDSFERFYWASNTGSPRYNTKARIAAGLDSFILGIPAPADAPGVAVTGGSTPTESRAYVYTWVSGYGEESPPSPPTLFTGNSDGTWNITVTAPGAVATDRNIEKVRIYRTVSGVGGDTDYFYVGEQAVANTTFDDDIASVTGNTILESLFWTPPPTDLQGLVSMPNGIVAGWRKNEVWFCHPYRPHAWPVTYQVSVDSDVVGLGVHGQSLVVCTETSPFVISGVNPGSMSVSSLAKVEPCTSRGSIISTQLGVLYTSPNGLILANASGLQNLTSALASKDDWGDLLSLTSVYGVQLGESYMCFGSTQVGCFSDTGFQTDAFLQQDFTGSYTGGYIDIDDARVAYSVMKSDVPVRSIFNDPWTGEVFLQRDDGVFWLEQSKSRPRAPFKWKSKVFETLNEENFEAMRVFFTTYDSSPDLNPVRNTSQAQTLAADQWGIVRVYADGILRMTRELRESGEFFRLPSGFKATTWQVEIESRVRINSVELASSAAELGSV